MRLPPTPCRVCFRPCVFNKFSHFWQNNRLPSHSRSQVIKISNNSTTVSKTIEKLPHGFHVAGHFLVSVKLSKLHLFSANPPTTNLATSTNHTRFTPSPTHVSSSCESADNHDV